MNRRIAMSAFSILSALALLGGGAFAAFSGSASAIGNTFSSGNAELKISSDNITYSASIANPFNGTNIAPGYSNPVTFYLKNTSTSSISLDLSVTFNTVVDGGLGNDLTAQFSCTKPGPSTTVGGTFNINTMNGGNVSLGSLAPGEVANCTGTFALPLSSTAAGSTVSFNAVFNGTQAP